jgi:2-hydroxy-6-oxonona-2,4-dienedioate hydrolase
MIAYPASAGGVMTRVIEAGSGERTVVFIHGLGARADRWCRNLDEIAALGFRCLALDLPGHGFAQKSGGFPYGVPGYADFIEAFLEERGGGPVHLVGTSLGAHVAATLAVRNPARIRSLALVGATGLFPIGRAAADGVATRIKDRSREGIARKLRLVMLDPARATPELEAEEHAINNSPGSDEAFDALSRYFAARIDEDAVGEKLAAIVSRFPLLLIWGEGDRSVPLEVGRRAAALLGARLAVMPNAAHAPYYEDPTKFNALLEEFLTGATT